MLAIAKPTDAQQNVYFQTDSLMQKAAQLLPKPGRNILLD
jgi:hypothetical protein